ncbi:MAG: MATE family efflux transporter [Prevotella sp.]|nr:MATE family efflux transporter [Prevotella sp.]
MENGQKSERLLAFIREGKAMTRSDKLNLIFQLSIPAILAQVTTVMMFFIDQAMVGSLGAEASAACGLVESSTWLFSSVASAASMGFSVQVAHFIGANDFVKARQVVRHAVLVTAALSLLLMLIAAAISRPLPYWLGGGADIADDASNYFLIFTLAAPFFQFSMLASSLLKCEGNMRVASIMSVVMCVLDVTFNFLLIFPSREIGLFGIHWWMPGAGLGVPGAALGTGLSFIVGAVLLGWFVFFKSKILAIGKYREKFVYVSSYLINALKIGSPMALQSFLMSSAYIVSTIIVAPLGNVAIAANTFAITAESLCYMPGYGIGDAATTLVGQSMGAGRKDLCRSLARLTVFTGMIVMALMGLVMYVFAPEMMGLMTPVAEIRDLGAQCLRIEAFAEPMFAASIVTYSVFVGAGDTFKPAMMNLGSMWLVRLSMAAILAKSYGLRGVWLAMAMELSFRGLIFLYRLFRVRWEKGIIKE